MLVTLKIERVKRTFSWFQGSMSISDQLCAYPSPNLILILTCYKLTDEHWVRGGVGAQLLKH